MNEDSISVIDAAGQLGMRKQTLFKIIKPLNIDTTKQRSSDHKGQGISYISHADFKRIAEDRRAHKEDAGGSEPTTPAKSSHGVFYLIQLEPRLDPGRFKLGFASNMPERKRKLKCSAPYLKVVQTWPCHEMWERTAIDSVTRGCKKVHTEVFTTKDIASVRERCDAFFGLMPSLDAILR